MTNDGNAIRIQGIRALQKEEPYRYTCAGRRIIMREGKALPNMQAYPRMGVILASHMLGAPESLANARA